MSPAPGEPLKPVRNYRGEASTSINSLLPCIAAQDNSNSARKEAWSSLRHPKLPKRLSEQPGLYFSPHMTDKLRERTKPALAQLQRNVFLWQRGERWSGCHVFPLNFCLSPEPDHIQKIESQLAAEGKKKKKVVASKTQRRHREVTGSIQLHIWMDGTYGDSSSN